MTKTAIEDELLAPKVSVHQESHPPGCPGWYYTISNLPPPHQDTVTSCGPFLTRKIAEDDAKCQVRWHMKVWRKAKVAGNPNCK